MTGSLVEGVLERRPHPEQGYRSCLSHYALGKDATHLKRLEAACSRALSLGVLLLSQCGLNLEERT